MRDWLREPLVHFVVLGAGLFALDAWLGEPQARARDDEIVVSAGRVENLAALFAKTWKRPPTGEELRRLVDDHVLEEVLYREGLAMGLDQDDTVVRRRIRQKLEFVLEDLFEHEEPTEAELEAWLAERPGTYALDARTSFRQVLLDPARRGEAVQQEAEALLAALRSPTPPADPAALGDGALLGHRHEELGAAELGRTFGPDFARELADAPAGAWSGPLASPYGLHLVYVEARREGRAPALDEVREAVERDWRYARRDQATRRLHAELVGRYAVSVEWPAPP